MNTEDMGGTLKKVKFKNNGMVTNPKDSVGETLGGNKGKNEQMGTLERVISVKNAPKLFTDESSHSNYKCSDNPNAECGDRP